MATGDTIAGQVRVVREDTEGNRSIVAGPFSQDKVDYTNNSVTADGKLYLNTQFSDRISAPLQAEERAAPSAVFESGEKLIVEHKANASATGSIDVSADSFNLSALKLDKNRGRIYPTTLTQADQELSSDPEESTTGWVDFYQETVADRTQVRLVGSFEAVAIES